MLLYLWLEVKQRNALWVVGIVSAAFYVYICYAGKIYADMALNIYYLFASIYGLVLWRRGKSKAPDSAKPEVSVRRTSAPIALKLLLATTVLFVVITFLLKWFTDSPVPYADAFTSALSIVGMYMLAHRLIEQWGVWFVVNIASMILYYSRERFPSAVLFLIYSIVSVIGYFQWKKELQRKVKTKG